MINLFDSNPINGHRFMNDLKKEFDKREMKQTAVDFAVEQLEKLIPSGNQIIIGITLDKAKKMEKEQIEEAFTSGEHQQGFEGEAEQYYQENYGDK